MTDNGRLYDPHGGVQPEQQGAGNSTIDHIQAQINAVTTKMQQNIQGASERGQRLDHLQNQSSNLQENASHFNRRANKLRKDMWWKDMKMRICIIVGIIILLIVIIVPSVVATKGH